MTRHNKVPKIGYAYKLRNLGRSIAVGWVKHKIANLLRIAHLYGTLKAVLIRADGSVVNYGLISARLVTTAFVNHLVDELQAYTEFNDYKYHDSGVGITAAAVLAGSQTLWRGNGCHKTHTESCPLH